MLLFFDFFMHLSDIQKIPEKQKKRKKIICSEKGRMKFFPPFYPNFPEVDANKKAAYVNT